MKRIQLRLTAWLLLSWSVVGWGGESGVPRNVTLAGLGCQPGSSPPLTSMDQGKSAEAVGALEAYLALEFAERPPLADQPFATTSLSRADAERARGQLWNDHAARIRRERRDELKAGKLREGKYEMPFFWKKFGEKPADGWSLYISLHGGGGTTHAANDQQWENQKRLYRLEEGIYLVPRAPTDTWNLWHQQHIDGLLGRLIESLIVLEGVNPNRVYLMGYSAGGDGVFQLAPRTADRLAAAAMMAGHPNETSPLGLRNIGFAIYMGGRDAAYNRNRIAAEWKEQLAALQRADPVGYRHQVTIFPDKGHWMDREDAAALPWMARFTRDPLPKKVVWKQDDVWHDRFYWLAIDQPPRTPRSLVIATRQRQEIAIETCDSEQLVVRLNDTMLNLDEEVVINFGRQTLFRGRLPRTIGLLAKTTQRGDPKLVFSAEIQVDLPSHADERQTKAE